MSDNWFAILFTLCLLAFAAIAVVCLLWPSKFLRHIKNPWQPDTPINRVYTRAVGIYFFLFPLMVFSGSMKTLDGFHRNILLALSVSPIFLAVFLWILWQYSPLQQVNRRYLVGEDEDPHWELRMSLTFGSLLSIIVMAAF